MTPFTRSALLAAAALTVSERRSKEVADYAERKERKAHEAPTITLVHNKGTAKVHDRKGELVSTYQRVVSGPLAGTKKARRMLRRAARRVLVTHHAKGAS